MPRPASSNAYFERLSPTAFLATEHVGGAWVTHEQHIAPAIGLVAHEVTRDNAERRGGDLQLSRLSCDILGTLPIAEVELTTRVLRPGRTIELVEARLSHAGRDAVVARAWLTKRYDTAALAGSPLSRIAAPHEMAAWDPRAVWPGGFIRSVEVRREQSEPGRARFWVRTPLALVACEAVGPTARALGLVDIANGMTVRVPLEEAFFPNVDLTLHLFRTPVPGWTGFDTAVTFGPTGMGVTTSVLHDEEGPFGSMAQGLTVRPRGERP